jgi:uncharacterized protein (TIGR03067 family)
VTVVAVDAVSLQPELGAIMKKLLPISIGMFLAGLILTQRIFAADKTSDFDGTWELTYFEREGKEVKLQSSTRWINGKGKFIVQRGDEVIAAGTSKLDPTQKPKALDITYTDGPDKGKTFKGIYEVDGDTVKFCRAGSSDDPRPSEFKTKAGSRDFVSVYKRVKP